MAHRPHAASPRSHVADRRPRQHAGDHRQRRRAGADRRHRCDRFWRHLRPIRRQGAAGKHRVVACRHRQEIAGDCRRALHLHQSEPHHRDFRLSHRHSKAHIMNMTPKEIVSELDKHVVGQGRAKRAVAIALRNRWRRQQVAEPLRHEITPKNILMIGPTGVGKTEIARRLAKLADAPFIKIEATKFTEVGYVGRDVDTIIRDLIDIGIKQTREAEMRKVRARAEDAAEDRVLDILLPPARDFGFTPDSSNSAPTDSTDAPENKDNNTRQTFRKRLREGALDDREIELDLAEMAPQMEIMAPPGMEEMTEQIKSMFSGIGNNRKKTRKVKIREAMKLLIEEEAGKLINEDELKQKAITNVEQNGIVFLDEIDKIATRSQTGAEVSRAGVQRDLLPLVEGTTVNTKYGMIKT